MCSAYTVRKLNKDIKVRVPGSKSITNRSLLLGTLANGITHISGASLSDDSKVFIEALRTLGVDISFTVNDDSGLVSIHGTGGVIPANEAEVYVGSAGTAARFLTAMLAFSDGTYTVRASEQMSKRPMKELTETLATLGAKFTYLEEEYHFPFIINGIFNNKSTKRHDEYAITINIDKSSQFLSAILMAAPMLKAKLTVTVTGNRLARSYVGITTGMMEKFGIKVERADQDTYVVNGGEDIGYSLGDYLVEPDVSAACYFYSMAAVNGISACVNDVHMDSIQGDIRFLELLKSMGCTVNDTDEGVVVTGDGKSLHGIDIDMSDFSDQVLTLAAIAPFADDKVVIRNVSHIRNQESDRLLAAANELAKLGIKTELSGDGITIYPGKISPADIETYNDHRVAMSFAVTGTKVPGITILNPGCAAKTFPDYFEILDKITEDA